MPQLPAMPPHPHLHATTTRRGRPSLATCTASTGCGKSAVAGPEVPVEILKKRMEDAENADDAQEAKEMYNTLQKNREFMRNVVKTVVDSVTADDDLTDAVFTDNVELTKYDCYYAAVDEFHDKCFNVGKNDYALRMLNTFVNLCEKGFDEEVIKTAIHSNCNHPHMYGIH